MDLQQLLKYSEAIYDKSSYLLQFASPLKPNWSGKCCQVRHTFVKLLQTLLHYNYRHKYIILDTYAISQQKKKKEYFKVEALYMV